MLPGRFRIPRSAFLCLFLASVALAIPPIQVGTVKGTIHQAGVRCICPISQATVDVYLSDVRLGTDVSDSTGTFSIITPVGTKISYHLIVTHPDYMRIDTVVASDSAGNVNLYLSMWRKTVIDPKVGPEWLSIGYPQQWYFVQMPSPAGYYGTLYADATQKTRLRDLYSSTLDLGIFNGKLSKVRGQLGIINAALPAKRALTPPEPKLIASKADLAQKDRVVIEYVHTSGPVSPQSQFMNMLSVDETGRVTYTENPCPMCDYLPMPKVDTVVSIEKVNALLDLFNVNGFWGFDTIIRALPAVIGGSGYSLSCDGTAHNVFGLPDLQEKAIIDGLEAFIEEITTSSSIHADNAGTSGRFGQVYPKGGSIHFAAPERGPVQLYLYDLAGRLVLEFRPDRSNFAVPARELRPGIYLARMVQGAQVTVSRFAVVP